MKALLRISAIVLLYVSPIIFSSCSKDDEVAEPAVLEEATFFQTRTANELKTYINSSALDFDVSALKHDVDVFKVKYKTTYKDEEIIASGFVVIPKTSNPAGMVSFQHGTITAHKDAPTASPLNDTELILYACLGSAGFIGVVPDYIGFGESKNVLHPYYVEEATASSVIDNLKAARELAKQKKVTFNKRLFLAGYSQGGYATMAAHKAIETDGLNGFELIASFPASGGYDVKGMQEYFFGQQTYHQPHYLAYVALSYQSFYSWNGAIADFFNEPYAGKIPGLFNGNLGADAINSQLTEDVSQLVKSDLLQNINTASKYNYLAEAFNENSLTDWTPKIKMFMYHGDADITVPYQNSISTYNKLLDNGASTDVVKFKTLPGATHSTGVLPYLEDMIPTVLSLQ
jgi:pimeloyl-ACP methyl ester carboxylesterase